MCRKIAQGRLIATAESIEVLLVDPRRGGRGAACLDETATLSPKPRRFVCHRVKVLRRQPGNVHSFVLAEMTAFDKHWQLTNPSRLSSSPPPLSCSPPFEDCVKTGDRPETKCGFAPFFHGTRRHSATRRVAFFVVFVVPSVTQSVGSGNAAKPLCVAVIAPYDEPVTD